MSFSKLLAKTVKRSAFLLLRPFYPTGAAGSCSLNAMLEMGMIASETALPPHEVLLCIPHLFRARRDEGACAAHFPGLAPIRTAAEGTGRPLSCLFCCAGFATWAPGVSVSGPAPAAPRCSVRAPWNRRQADLPIGVMVGGSDRRSSGLRAPRRCWPGWEWCGGRR